jgi:beige protein homolog 1
LQNALTEFLLSCTINALMKQLLKKKNIASDPRALTPFLKLVTIAVDETYRGLYSLNSGLFRDDSTIVIDFVITMVDLFLEAEEDAAAKGYKVDFSLGPLYKQLNRIILYQFGKLEVRSYADQSKIVSLLRKLIYYENQIWNIKNADNEFLKAVAHHALIILKLDEPKIHQLMLKLWKVLLLKKSNQISAVLRSPKGSDFKEHIEGFSKLLADDDKGFARYFAERKDELFSIFAETATRPWEAIKQQELKLLKESEAAFLKQRSIRIKSNYKRHNAENEMVAAYNQKSQLWVSDVQSVEYSKLQKFKQDYQVMQESIESEWRILSRQLMANHSILEKEDEKIFNWMLDFTEGRTRMRKKLRKLNKSSNVAYLSKQELVAMNSPTKAEQTIITNRRELRAATVSGTSPNPAHLKLRRKDSQSTTSPDAAWPMSPCDTDLISAILTEAEEFEDMSEIEEGDVPSNDDDGELVIVNNETAAKEETDEEKQWEQISSQEDQNRKIARLLDPEDEIVDTVNSGRLLGLELCEGLSIICKKNFYMIDNYFQRSDGDLIEIDDVTFEERNIYHWIVTAPARKSKEKAKFVIKKDDYHTCRKCSYGDIREVHKRLYLFRNVALEMFLADGRNFFLTFWSTKTRDAVYHRLLSKTNINAAESVAGVSSTQNQLQTVIYGGSPLAELTQKWCNREISNLAYLMHINTLAGRSYNDLTQYPTFPWILSDYDAEDLDLTSVDSFRDLSKPMGGQGARRALEFSDRYLAWDDNSLPACHYGTHYSSSMIVCSYLIRIEPFTQEYLNLQGGSFDHTDRLFHSIPTSWASASRLNTTDVRELIPEFFYLPDFLTNSNKFDFGRKQTGEAVDNVILPKWAKGNPRLFIQLHRAALESDYVSENIHNWIDLVFGFKQQGEEAAKALNVFHYLSYEGAVGNNSFTSEIDKIDDPVQKQATIGIIHNFGQSNFG